MALMNQYLKSTMVNPAQLAGTICVLETPSDPYNY